MDNLEQYIREKSLNDQNKNKGEHKMKFDVKTIVKLSSYAVAGIALLTLVSSSPIHVGVIAAAGGAYFIAEKLM